MTKGFKDRLIGTLIVPVGLAIVLVPFSLLIGWNAITLLLFWLVLTPWLAIQAPKIVSNKKNHLLESSLGLIIFYGLMVFMIYDHYKSDYFQVMLFSGAFNLIIVAIIARSKTPQVQTQQ